MALNIKKPPAKTPVAVVKNAVATVTHTDASGVETQEQEVLGALAVEEHNHCMVTVGTGMTRNMGDYNSMKFYVSIQMPSKLDQEELDQTYESGKAWVDEKVNAINAEIDTIIG